MTLMLLKSAEPRNEWEAGLMLHSGTVLALRTVLQLTPAQFAVVLSVVIPKLVAEETNPETRAQLIAGLKDQTDFLEQAVERYLAIAAGGSAVTQ